VIAGAVPYAACSFRSEYALCAFTFCRERQQEDHSYPCCLAPIDDSSVGRSEFRADSTLKCTINIFLRDENGRGWSWSSWVCLRSWNNHPDDDETFLTTFSDASRVTRPNSRELDGWIASWCHGTDLLRFLLLLSLSLCVQPHFSFLQI